jgi:U32 family peptidase
MATGEQYHEKQTSTVVAGGSTEIMAPAGDWESLAAAFQAGADSVYFGIEQLNMRARASGNFTMDDLPEIASLAKEKGVRTYLTLNTVLYDHDLPLMKRIIDKVKETGITAIIAADQAAISYAFKTGVEVHISTQANISNIEMVEFYSHFADVMVLARELSLGQVAGIVQGIQQRGITGPSGRPVQIEVFAHGALCMAVSGKCYLSLHTYNSSANRGACKQNCRHAYTVTNDEGIELEIDNEYIMSPKDLCTIDFLDRILAAGVTVLKLEGRGRSPEYVKTVTRCYKEAAIAVADGIYTPERLPDGKTTWKKCTTVASGMVIIWAVSSGSGARFTDRPPRKRKPSPAPCCTTIPKRRWPTSGSKRGRFPWAIPCSSSEKRPGWPST